MIMIMVMTDDDDDDDDDDDCRIQDAIRLADEPRHARKRRKRIEKMIKDLDKEHSNKHPNSPLPIFSARSRRHAFRPRI